MIQRPMALPGTAQTHVGLCLCLLLSYSCVLGQMSLSASGPGILKPFQLLEVTCKLTGILITSSYDWSWVRQLPTKEMEWLGHINGDGATHYPDSFKKRLSITRDVTNNKYSMLLASVTSKDTATYYCARRIYYGYFDYWGSGTMVTVTSDPISAPMVYPMMPCCNHIGSGEPITIGCLATGYLPDPVNMTWNSGYTSTGVTTFASVYSSARGVYMRSTQLTVPAGNWASYQCSVLHEYTGLKQEKIVTVIPCTAPSVKTFLSPLCDAFSDDRATSDMNSTTMEIMCTIGGFHPGHVQVQWLANGQPATLPASTTSPMKGKDGLFSASSRLTVPKGEWNRGTLYSCSVTHPATNTSTLANISNCAEPCPCSMGVFLLPPTFEDLYLSQRAHLTCLVTNMKTTESFEFLWAREKGAELDVVTDDPKLHDNGTFTVVSRLSICAEDWLNGQKFSCTIKHPDLSSPVQVDIAKRKERSPNPPAVYLLPPSPEEVALQELVTITCLVKGFNPKDVFVRWLEKDKEVGKGYYTTTDPIAVLTGGSYFLYSSLQVKSDTWEEGVPFSCVVGHEALPMHLTQKTVDKFTGKPSSINVSLVMSDSASSCY